MQPQQSSVHAKKAYATIREALEDIKGCMATKQDDVPMLQASPIGKRHAEHTQRDEIENQQVVLSTGEKAQKKGRTSLADPAQTGELTGAHVEARQEQ